MSASSGASIRVSNSTKLQRPATQNVLLSEAVARDKAVMTRLMLAALSGMLFAFAAILTTLIDWTILGWRNFWLAVWIAAFLALIRFLWMACKRF